MTTRLRCRRSRCRLLLSLRQDPVDLWVVLGWAQPLGRAEAHPWGRRWVDGQRLARPSRLTSEPEDVCSGRFVEGRGKENDSR